MATGWRRGISGIRAPAAFPDLLAEVVRGAAAVAARAFPFSRIAQVTLPALINGAVGIITAADSKPVTLVGFMIVGAKITAIDLIDNPCRIAEADLAILCARPENRLRGLASPAVRPPDLEAEPQRMAALFASP